MSEQTLTAAQASAWSVEIRRADDALNGLGAEWDDLFGRCAVATPFQSYAWLESWWRSYGEPGRLRLTLIRYGDQLVAAAPMMLRWRTGCPVLTPLGGSFSDFTDVLLDDTMASPAAAVLAANLIRQPGWQAIDFPETRPGSMAATALSDAWPGDQWSTPASLCLELAATPMENLVQDLPQHSRKTVRRRLNQLKRAGLDIREVCATDAKLGVAELLRLHELQWQGRGLNRAHIEPEFFEHLSRSSGAMIGQGQAALLEYRIGGKLMASSLVLIGRGLVGGYLYGADPTLREHVDVTTMLLADTLPMAHRLGRPTMSMLRGAEEHKMRWRPAESQNQRILLARPGSLPGAAYANGVLAYRAGVRVAKARAPWLRTVRHQLRWPR